MRKAPAWRLPLSLLILSAPGLATAEENAPPSEVESDSSSPQLVPYRRDTVGGHLSLRGSVAYVAPFGHLSEEVRHEARAGDGIGINLNAGFGLNRHVVVGVYGDMQWYGSSQACAACSAVGHATGLLVRYHFSQGLKMDPWISYGAGFRDLRADIEKDDYNYAGLEWFRLSMGATWFAIPQFGFGPTLQFGATSFFKTPSDEQFGGVNWRMHLGLELVFDALGK